MTKPQVKYLKDYQAPPYFVDTIDLHIELYEEYATVKSFMQMRRNKDVADESTPLVLDGKEMEIVSVFGDDALILPGEYRVNEESLVIPKVPDRFTLEINTKIRPKENTSLEGLYMADGIFLTQCEAEGFRRITYFPDRPDVMSVYTCTIVADKAAYPYLLSNGNLIKEGGLEDGRHFAVWEDPFRKPSYLFALVAGDLACREGSYRTRSGREVALRFYVDKVDGDKCDHAIESLKRSMAWDEEVYGLEYDLDLYMVVATHAFNAGAMENKGLNVFNSKYVLARPETATDLDFQNIEGVIGHEYFHNWTGNRVTLNSWFQLSLKEGLTVFRDQEFSSDMGSRAIKRISDVRGLRAGQFAEDAGPMAHPIRPESYIEMNNFYTSTVYNKGAEVIRMIHTLLGADNFRRGMDLYFERFDGQAVTTEDFVKAMEDASGVDLGLFRLWYSQAGTPRVTLERSYDPEKQTLAMTFTQKVPDTPGQTDKKPMHIPVRMGLLDSTGRELPLCLEGEDASEAGRERVLSLTRGRETFTFVNVPENPVPSLFRGFSAPVVMDAGYSDDELLFLMAHDPDSFNRWDAAQQLFGKTILGLVADLAEGRELVLDGKLVAAFRKTLVNGELDKALIAQALSLPTENELGDKMDEIDVDGIHAARVFIKKGIAQALRDDFKAVLEENRETGAYTIDQPSIARRKLKNLALSYLAEVDDEAMPARVFEAFRGAGNMTDEISALSVLAHMDAGVGEEAVNLFYEKWQADTLVLDKWFVAQATSLRPGTLDRVKGLMDHPAFSIKNPNKVRSLIGAFCQGNPWHFHQADGAGYRFLADAVLSLDKINSSIAARMVSAFNKWKRYDAHRQGLMKAELERIVQVEGLSNGVYEIVSKALG